MHEIKQAGALGAECAAIDRMIGVPLNMDDRGLGILCPVSQAAHDDAATNRAIGAGVANLRGTLQLECAGLRQSFGRREAQHCDTGTSESAGANLEKLPSCHSHFYILLWWNKIDHMSGENADQIYGPIGWGLPWI